MIIRDDNKSRCMNIDQMICLCYIIDDFSKFRVNLDDFLSSEDNRNDIAKLHLISNGRDDSLNKKAKKFYQKNKEIIDRINSFTNIGYFITDNYDFKSNCFYGSCLDSFYDYIVLHRDRLDHILLLLNKIKKLGFSKVMFDESLDFTCKTYDVFYNFGDNFDIAYLDNMEVISSYQPDVLNYKSNFSNYRMVFRQNNLDLSSLDRKISVNSLLFNLDRLPDEVSKETIFDFITGLSRNESDDYAIRDYVDLSVAVDDLCKQFGMANSILERLTSIDDKSELIRILNSIRNCLCELNDYSNKCCKDIVDKSSISQEQFDLEKKKFLSRRHL